jgi:hypothetical protein
VVIVVVALLGRKAAGQECRSEHYYTCRLLIPINDIFHRSGWQCRKAMLWRMEG